MSLPTPEHDELYDDAVKIVRESGKASEDLLMRRLRIGYGRAAGLLDAMADAGIVSSPVMEGLRHKREVLKRL